jgi:beta-glucosidase
MDSTDFLSPKRFGLTIAKRVLVTIIAATFTGCASYSYDQPSPRVADLIEKMTLEEKVQLLHGYADSRSGAGAIQGIERLNIPSMMLTDGPAGARNKQYLATAMPAPVALAATFNSQLAYQVGKAIGKEARAQGQDVLLAPMVNIARTPQAGRNFETLGEDPLLAGEMATEQIKGVQDAGLMATVKHYLVNNQETDRMTVNTVVDEQALHEIYLPAFKQAVTDGHVASIMCSYNKIAINDKQSEYACANYETLTEILRHDWGFDGFVMTDWFAGIPGVFTPDAKPSPNAIKAGLDVEMPGDDMFGQTLIDAVRSGDIAPKYVDHAAIRLLNQMDRFGLLDNRAPDRTPIALMAESHSAIAKQSALEGAVLLKNERRTLPLRADDLASLLVIGPTGGVLNYGGGGSSRVRPLTDLLSPIDAIKQIAGEEANITYLPGIDLDGVAIPETALQSGETNGLSRVDDLGNQTVDGRVDFVADNTLPSGKTYRWQGTLTAPETGEYDLYIQLRNAGAKLSLDGGKSYILDTMSMFSAANSSVLTRDGLENSRVRISMSAGETKSIVLKAETGYSSVFSPFIDADDSPSQLRLAWQTPSERKAHFDQAIKAAPSATAVVIFAYNEGTEGVDRETLSLPQGQDQLIRQLAVINPNTTVVLNTGDSVTMPWVDEVPAILEMWYPGQEGATATAELLLGKANPSGRLPVTFPMAETDTYTYRARNFPGINSDLYYDEGIYVGYRWFDKHQIKPLFGFGHGLSYTKFDYSRAQVQPVDDGYRVTFTVTNTGIYAGTDVPQIYLGAPAEPSAPVAPKVLVGFKRLLVKSGDSEQVSIMITPDQLKHWNSDHHQWQTMAGHRTIYLGHSSQEVKPIAAIYIPTAR